MNLKEIYNNNKKSEGIIIDDFNSLLKPLLVDGLISSESKVSLNSIFSLYIKIDDDAVYEIIDIFEKKNGERKEEEKNQINNVLADVYYTAHNYLGKGKINDTNNNKSENRDSMYMKKDYVNLSEFRDKGTGLCVEMALIGHQLLTLLELGNRIEYHSYYTSSFLSVDEISGSHAFIILKNKESDQNLLFDIINSIILKNKNDNKEYVGLGVYNINDSDLDSFIKGDIITPQNIYEERGYETVKSPISYGTGFGSSITPNDMRF